MAKRSYDENKCLKSISKVTQINYSNHTVVGHPDVPIGIRRLGKIDYLCNYCGWHFYWDREARIGHNYVVNPDAPKSARQTKKEKKQPKLKNKNKK
jgi:hypothetical protein